MLRYYTSSSGTIVVYVAIYHLAILYTKYLTISRFYAIMWIIGCSSYRRSAPVIPLGTTSATIQNK
jgi:hypothetical protein